MERNLVYQPGCHAKDLFDALYKRGHCGIGNDAEVKKAVPAYIEIIKLLGIPFASDADDMTKAYDKLTDQKIKTRITKLLRTATTWGKYSDDIAASYDESLAEDTDMAKNNEGQTKNNKYSASTLPKPKLASTYKSIKDIPVNDKTPTPGHLYKGAYVPEHINGKAIVPKCWW